MNRFIGASAAIALLLVVCVTSIAWFLGRSSSADVIAAKEVRACMTMHHLRMAKQTVSRPQSSELVFASCTWPPRAWAGQDGYSEIIVTTFDGPGRSEVSDADEADYIRAPCQRVELTYDFGSQGVYKFLHPFVATVGTVTSEDHPGQQWHGAKLTQYPGRNEIVYLRNDDEGLVSATCRA